MAYVLRNSGRNEESEALQYEVVKLDEEILGNDHSNTLLTTQDLALTWYYALKRSNEAMTLMNEVVKIGMDVLGDEHYLMVRSLNFLKRWREEQRRDVGEIIELGD